MKIGISGTYSCFREGMRQKSTRRRLSYTVRY